ncbi:hypothetical protein SAMN04487830_1624 [Pseudobutyrivibrio sp. OR37]|nr:hypothetical protein SAMN04487830_1624 [Pseudobutyrivibrio sp. OR37]
MENFDALSPTMKYDIAKVQGDILQLAADKGYDMEEFIENYMTSDFCNNEIDFLTLYKTAFAFDGCPLTGRGHRHHRLFVTHRTFHYFFLLLIIYQAVFFAYFIHFTFWTNL